MLQLLKTKERTDLTQRNRKERDDRVRDRIKALLLDDAEYYYSEMARILLLDDETIRRHIKYYDSTRDASMLR